MGSGRPARAELSQSDTARTGANEPQPHEKALTHRHVLWAIRFFS